MRCIPGIALGAPGVLQSQLPIVSQEFKCYGCRQSGFRPEQQRGERQMLGLMMNRPLMISALLQHAAQNHNDTEIVSRLPVGGTHRYTYGDAHRRSRELARVLLSLGVKAEDRIGTLAWNTHRHFEIYFAVSGMAAICHTINPRLFPNRSPT
jgi:long-subunit acyl-CoA synthetase (AMP-forming)